MTEIESNTARSEFFQKRTEAMTAIKAALATVEPDGSKEVRLEEITVQWEGETMSAAALMNHMGIEDMPTDNVNSSRTEEELLAVRQEIDNDLRDGTGDDSASTLRKRRADVDARLRTGSAQGSDSITGNALDSYIENLQSQARRMNSGNEVLMVQMQSAMQQRSQVVTMATQMLKSINDSASRIAGNMG